MAPKHHTEAARCAAWMPPNSRMLFAARNGRATGQGRDSSCEFSGRKHVSIANVNLRQHFLHILPVCAQNHAGDCPTVIFPSGFDPGLCGAIHDLGFTTLPPTRGQDLLTDVSSRLMNTGSLPAIFACCRNQSSQRKKAPTCQAAAKHIDGGGTFGNYRAR